MYFFPPEYQYIRIKYTHDSCYSLAVTFWKSWRRFLSPIALVLTVLPEQTGAAAVAVTRPPSFTDFAKSCFSKVSKFHLATSLSLYLSWPLSLTSCHTSDSCQSRLELQLWLTSETSVACRRSQRHLWSSATPQHWLSTNTNILNLLQLRHWKNCSHGLIAKSQLCVSVSVSDSVSDSVSV